MSQQKVETKLKIFWLAKTKTVLGKLSTCKKSFPQNKIHK